MLPKTQRVSRKLFLNFFKKTRLISSPYFNFRFTELQEKQKSRFSFIISSKIEKKAVKRNFFRRKTYSIIEKHKNSIKNSFVCLFFFKKDALKLSFNGLEKEILSVLKKSGIYK